MDHFVQAKRERSPQINRCASAFGVTFSVLSHSIMMRKSLLATSQSSRQCAVVQCSGLHCALHCASFDWFVILMSLDLLTFDPRRTERLIKEIWVARAL